MWERLKQLAVGSSRREPTIVLTGTRFAVVRKGRRVFKVRWADVREVFAFKQDCFTYDRICVGFRVSAGGDYHAVDEDMPGYEALLQEVYRRYPDYDRDWWSKVVSPAFAPNYTPLWGGPTDDATGTGDLLGPS